MRLTRSNTHKALSLGEWQHTGSVLELLAITVVLIILSSRPPFVLVCPADLIRLSRGHGSRLLSGISKETPFYKDT